jgi:hypothetical protein
VAWPRLNEYRMGRFHQRLAKSNAFDQGTWPDEDLRVSNNANHSAQHLGRNAVARVSIDDRVEPVTTQGVIARVRTKCVYKHVDIGKDQRFAIRSSRSLERFRSIPGNVPPEAFETGKFKRTDDGEWRGSARTTSNPSSMREVSVLPFSAAFFFAFRKRASESRMVVRICLSIIP